MAEQTNVPRIELPRAWQRQVRPALLHVIALAQYAVAYTRAWAVNARIARVRLKAENDQLRQEVALLTEEIAIKDARTKRIAPQKRPRYASTEGMAILELRAARARSAQQTAEAFLVRSATIGSWMKRADEEGADALAVRCWPEMPNLFGQWPYFGMARLADQGLAIACEGDADGAVSAPVGEGLGMGRCYLSDWLERGEGTITLWHGRAAPMSLSPPQGEPGAPCIARRFTNHMPGVDDATPVVSQDDHAVEQPGPHRCENEEVNRSECEKPKRWWTLRGRVRP